MRPLYCILNHIFAFTLCIEQLESETNELPLITTVDFIRSKTLTTFFVTCSSDTGTSECADIWKNVETQCVSQRYWSIFKVCLLHNRCHAWRSLHPAKHRRCWMLYHNMPLTVFCLFFPVRDHPRMRQYGKAFLKGWVVRKWKRCSCRMCWVRSQSIQVLILLCSQ